jgi:hypothetical protein
MKKINPKIRSRASRIISFQILFILTLSLLTNPLLAIAASNANLEQSSINSSQQTGSGISETRPAKQPELLIPTTVFSNPAAITIPDMTSSSVQSNITVSGMAGTISSVNVTLTGITTCDINAYDMLLVGPGGQKYIFMSDVGDFLGSVSGITLTISDSGATQLPNTGALPSGTYKPANYADIGDAFPSPAPAGPYSSAGPEGSPPLTLTNVFGGSSTINGTWSLFINDGITLCGGANSTISGGWSLDITSAAAASTTTVVSGSPNPSFRNQAVTITSTTTSASTVNSGTVTFFDSTTSTNLCTNVAVNGSGVATCTVPANTLSERRHLIQANYAGNATFSPSSGSYTQTVNCPVTQVGNTFTNPCGITLVDNNAPSIPYPSNIVVSGLTGSISKVTLTLTNTTLSNTNDNNFLLVGPAGQTFVFFSDAGGNGATSGANIVFDDAAINALPNSGAIASGTYRPTDYNVDSETYPAPAPAGPYNSAAPTASSTFASVYGGAAPNGTWSLYPIDDSGSSGAGGTIGSWSLTFTTTGDAATTTTVSGNPNPSTTAQSFLVTANVTSTSTVNVGTVTFRNGATVLCANVAVSGGTATCNVPAQPQGSYVITADYNGFAGAFNISSGNYTQVVNSPTVVTCNNFANNGGITVTNSSTGNPYPSNIIVGGLGGTISKVTVSVNGLTTATPDDLDLLLVGPNGQTLLFMGDAGGSNALSGVNLTFDDAAASLLPDSTAISSGTWKPTSQTGFDSFPSPAPASITLAAPEGAGTLALFNSSNPNGTWKLYSVEDSGDGQNATITSWSLTFTLAAVATTTSVTSNADPSVFGQPVTFTATVTTAGLGTPSGIVQFKDNGNNLGAPVALNGSGVATLLTSALTVGDHTITADYGGASSACTGTFNASTGSLATNPQTVNKASTTTGLASSSNPVGTNTPVTFTATVNPVAPGAGTRTGTVTFFRNGSPVCSNVAINASGQAQCVLTFTLAGNYNITVQYSGDTNFNASATASPLVQQVVGPTAANVSVVGRVFSQETGRALYNARVVITDSSGQSRTVNTNMLGYFRFTEVPAGATYTFTIYAKGYQTQQVVRSIIEDVTDFNILLTNQ